MTQRYFRTADASMYEQIRLGLDAAWGHPTAGTVIRRMKVIMTIGGSSSTKERREVLTYDGSATAKLQITDNGTTKNCTVALPRGRPNCS
jgi:hypothetical protein